MRTPTFATAQAVGHSGNAGMAWQFQRRFAPPELLADPVGSGREAVGPRPTAAISIARQQSDRWLIRAIRGEKRPLLSQKPTHRPKPTEPDHRLQRPHVGIALTIVQDMTAVVLTRSTASLY